VLRDFLAIHDDIVDEDVDKFGSAPLPVRFSRLHDFMLTDTVLTKHGKDLALFYGDFLLGLLLQLAADTGPRSAEVSHLLGDTLYVNQRGQLAELLAEEKPFIDTSVDDVFLIGERKAAYYCYSFPFTLGATMAGHPPALIDPVNALLTAIGTLSQAIDDLTGTFPGIIDNDKDTLGEIIHLRRTLPLVLLAHSYPRGDITTLLNASPPLPESDARRLREHLWNSTVPAQALAICQRRLDAITPQLRLLPTGAAATEYLADLVQFRLTASINRFAEAP
jgi:geranylgeranyl pyrophosphate synthase